ncbi:MAG: helix-turn-helix domain-containing protein [Candidatus Acidiferrum sp.]
MPPSPDKKLEERILQAAMRLWRALGPRGMTLRAVAQQAGTTTPTVYKRFRNKQALQIALALRARQQLLEELFSAATVEEIPARYVDYAERHPNECQLLWSTWTDIFHPNLPRPGRSWFLARLAERFGGKPEDYSRAFYAFFLLAHGAATLLTVPGDAAARDEVRHNFLSLCDSFIRNIEIFRD